MKYSIRNGFVTAGIVACIALSGCGTQQGTPSRRAAGPVSDGVESSPHDVLEGFSLLHYDYDPVESVEDIAASALAIVTGTVDEVVPGRTQGKGVFTAHHSAVKVTVDQVEKGPLAVGDDVWLEIRTEPDVLRNGLIPGLRVALYLGPRSYGGEPYSDAGSQVPTGATLWGLAHPQGLIVQYGEEQGTVAPFSEEIQPEATVEDALPEEPAN